MKKLFAYLTAALILSLMLCGCGGTMDQGNVASSPWPDMTVPTTPVPTAAVSPLPEVTMGIDSTTNSGTNSDVGTGTALPETSTSAPRMTSSPELNSSPRPTDTTR